MQFTQVLVLDSKHLYVPDVSMYGSYMISQSLDTKPDPSSYVTLAVL